MAASFMITGASKKETAKGLLKGIQEMAGHGSQVSINRVTGLIAVTSNAHGLERADRFIREYVETVDMTVSIHTAILEVQLNNSMQFGINWNKIVTIAGQSALSFGSNGIAPGLGIAQTGLGSGNLGYGYANPSTALSGKYLQPAMVFLAIPRAATCLTPEPVCLALSRHCLL